MDLSAPYIPLKIKQDVPYPSNVVTWIRVLYIIMAVFWIAIIYLLELYKIDWLGYIFLVIPLIVFFINYCNAEVVSPAVEEEVFQANYLSIGLIVVLPLLTWLSKEYPGDREKFTSIIIMALIFIMLSMIDIWLSRSWLSLMRHIQSSFQTLSLILLIYAIYYFYILSPHGFSKPRTKNDSSMIIS